MPNIDALLSTLRRPRILVSADRREPPFPRRGAGGNPQVRWRKLPRIAPHRIACRIDGRMPLDPAPRARL